MQPDPVLECQDFGGWVEHKVCPRDLPQPDQPTMNLLHPEQLGFFEGILSLFKKRPT